MSFLSEIHGHARDARVDTSSTDHVPEMRPSEVAPFKPPQVICVDVVFTSIKDQKHCQTNTNRL